MKTVLQQINLLPEVVGSMIIDNGGVPICQELPPLLDINSLQEAGSLISENIEVLQTVAGGLAMLDFRYQSGRIVVRSLNSGFLLLLCTPAVNMPLLNISLNVAVKRLEKLLPQHAQALRAKEEARKPENRTEVAAQLPPAPKKPKRVVAFSI